MGQMVIAAFRPKAGQGEALRQILRDHVPILRGQGLVTDRSPTFLQARDGTVLEIFEWKSAQAVAAAHENPVVLALWQRFGQVCDYLPLAQLEEAAELFPNFQAYDPGTP